MKFKKGDYIKVLNVTYDIHLIGEVRRCIKANEINVLLEDAERAWRNNDDSKYLELSTKEAYSLSKLKK